MTLTKLELDTLTKLDTQTKLENNFNKDRSRDSYKRDSNKSRIETLAKLELETLTKLRLFQS